jgi:deazaflavin-dependent oxidoreductase (nitroreductase family)
MLNLMIETKRRIPGYVGFFNRFVGRLLGAGVPMGPNAMLTVTGRKTGVARTTPVTLVEVGGRRWIQGAWGESNWVKNLRASGEATLSAGHRTEPVKAIELPRDEAVAFFRDVLGPYVRKVPFARLITGVLLKSPEFLTDPSLAAERHPVFELRPAASPGTK